jgi:hypothetical protein
MIRDMYFNLKSTGTKSIVDETKPDDSIEQYFGDIL